MVPQQTGPAGCPEDIGKINAADPNGEIAPFRFGKLSDYLVPVYGMTVLSVKRKGDETSENYQSQDQMSFVLAFSDSAVVFFVWAGLSLAAPGVKAIYFDRKRIIGLGKPEEGPRFAVPVPGLHASSRDG